MKSEEDAPEKGQIEREYMDRLHEQDVMEQEALKNSRIIKGADTKNYKKFKDVKYIPPPKPELSDEMKLVVVRKRQFLMGFIGFVCLGMTFFVIYDPTLYLSIFGNSIIILKIYNSMLYLSIFESYLDVEMNLILLGCTLVIMNIMDIIIFQHKHDKISDRISAGQRTRIRTKKTKRIYQALIGFMGLVGVGIIFLDIYYLTQHISIFENFAIVLSIYESMLYLSILEGIVVKMNLILLGGALAATSIGIIGLQYKRKRQFIGRGY